MYDTTQTTSKQQHNTSFTSQHLHILGGQRGVSHFWIKSNKLSLWFTRATMAATLQQLPPTDDNPQPYTNLYTYHEGHCAMIKRRLHASGLNVSCLWNLCFEGTVKDSSLNTLNKRKKGTVFVPSVSPPIGQNQWYQTERYLL